MNKHSGFEEQAREEIIEQLENMQNLSEMERQLRQILQVLGNLMLHAWILWLTPRSNISTVTCVYWSSQAKYVRQRKGTLRAMFGQIHYRRAYYLCQGCQPGHYPLDEKLGLRPNALSAEVNRLAGLMDVQLPFGQGSTIFEELTLVKLSAPS